MTNHKFYWVRISTAERSVDDRTWVRKKNAIKRAKLLIAECPEIRIAHVLKYDPWGPVSCAEFTGKAWVRS